MDSASALLHPVRLRIVQALVALDQATTRQLHQQLPDIPIATLYRHLSHLATHGLLTASTGAPDLGAGEKTYRLADDFSNPSPAAIRELSSDDLLTAFTVFTSTVISDFRSYLDTADYDLDADYAGFTTADFWASPDEMEEFAATLNAAVIKLAANAPTAQRRRRSLTTILIPRGVDGGDA